MTAKTEDTVRERARTGEQLTHADQVALGKDARGLASLESHAEFTPAKSRDPVGLLLEQDKSRVPELVPIRHGRMLVSPFAYYRGAALPTVTAHSESLSGGGTCSLEVRWIFRGQLADTMAGWFARFPAESTALEDAYLLEPYLPGLSVKVREGRALEVKVCRGNRDLLEVAGRACGRVESWRSGPFPTARPARAAITWLAGRR